MQQNYNKKRKLNKLKASLLTLMMVLFAMPAMAQVYMHNGSSYVGTSGVKFYDSGGASHGPANYWNHWFQRNQDFTYTFRPEGGTAIQVDFEAFEAYTDNNGLNDAHAIKDPQGHIMNFSLRLNTAELSIYEGESVSADKLITTLTGTIINPFTVMANGPITFHFKSYGFTEEGWGATVKAIAASDYTLQKPAISMEACSDMVVLYPTTLGAQIRYTLDGNPPTTSSTLYDGNPFEITVGASGTTVKAITVKGTQTCLEPADKTFTTDDLTPTPDEDEVTIVRDGNTLVFTLPDIPDHINETYGIIYTTASGEGTPEDPNYISNGNVNNTGTYVAADGWSGSMPGKAHFPWTTPNTNFKFRVVAQTCAKQSGIFTYHFDKLNVPDPVITLNDDDATISWTSGYVLRYTTNGTTPSTTVGTLVSSGTSVDLSDLAPGTTIKAISYKTGDNAGDYNPSNVVTKIYLPGGDGNSGVHGSIVIIDDREDHTWSYYQASANLPTDYPTTYLSSPDPRNVKITYKGGGVTNGSAVAISYITGDNSEDQNEILYLKTMEKTVLGMTGDYPYTVISNPFSKRPAVTSGNSKTYYGFAGWKVVSGGDYINEYNDDDVLPLDATIHFTNFDAGYTPNCLSADVVFEATWTEANVQTGTSAPTFNGGTYETNFWVLTGNPGSGVTVPANCTMTARYPDGTESWSGNFTRSITAGGNNAKVEFVNMNSTENVNAAGYTFTMGRGIVNSGNGGQLRGCTTDKACVHTVKIESGKYASLRHFTSSISANNTINQLMILGCDYDRARGWNNKLEITGSMYVAGDSYDLRRSSDVLYVRGIVKSGDFISGVTVNDSYTGAGGTQTYYFSVGNSNIQNAGRRYLVVEGGHLRGIAGGMDEDNDQSTTGRAFDLRVRGTAQIDGVVYGAAEYAGGRGTRAMIFTGGTINGWIAGGANGTRTDGGALNGASYVYVGGNTNVNSNASQTVMNRAIGGNVFGAGCGYSATSTSGQVQLGTNVVVADEAYVERGVYGGGSFGFCATGQTANIFVLGGKVDCVKGGVNAAGTTYSADIPGGVFGGALQNHGGIVNITVAEGTGAGEGQPLVNGSVYGGSNTSGDINGLATVTMSGGTVTNVFGGGLGVATNMAAGTKVNVSGGTINKNVYGGGEMGTVSAGNTVVNVSGGTMSDVYGAGKGEAAANGSKAVISGTTTVNVTGGNIANVYGGGENGNVIVDDGSQTQTQNKNVTVTIYGTHNQSYYNRDYITITPTGTNGGTTTIRWSRTETVDPQTVSVPCDQTITITYHRGSNGGTSNIAFTVVSEEGTEVDQQGRPANNETFTFTVASDPVVPPAPELASTVTINGGNVSKDVYGGGAYGTTAGSVIVNMKGGNVHGSVYGGALGEQHNVYVAGAHTVNVLGGHVFANVYGGSRNADDAYSFEPGDFDDATNEETVCVVNISGGQIDQQVYAAGFFGNCFGSVFAFVGKNAIYNAPNHVETAGSESAGETYEISKLSITGSVWAGGDWGTFTDHFGGPTISGKSNVYVDGLNYITNTSDKNTVGYMGIDGSLFGSGTSCDAGKKEHTVMLRNYGESVSPYSAATRDFASIQRADYLVLDNVHVDFKGQGRINSLNVTEVYAIYEVSEAVLVTNGSTLIMDAPVDQIKTFWSTSCGNVYTAALPTLENNGTTVSSNGGYTVLAPTDLNTTDNKVRVNGGNYIKIYYADVNGNPDPGYGMLNGYAHMMASNNSNEATCAYARPRWCYKNTEGMFAMNDGTYDNRNDGGWVSYVSSDNVFDLDGNAGNVQMAYENHTPGSKLGEAYFRIWRTTGEIHEREGIFDVLAEGNDVFKYVDVEIELPAWRGHDYYYAFETKGTAPNLNTTIDYGTELMTFNTALYDDDSWITYNTSTHAQVLEANTAAQTEIKAQPDVNYGLVILPGTANTLVSPAIGTTAAPALILNGDSDDFLAKVTGEDPNYTTVNRFDYTANDVMPTVTFRLTYSDLLSSNKTYEPMWVNLVQCGPDGTVTDIVKVKLVVNTTTTVGRNFVTEVYAVMNGQGSTADESHVQIVLPRFNLNSPGKDSEFTVQSISWTPNQTTDGLGELVTIGSNSFDKTKFAMEFSIADNYDGTTGWNELTPEIYDTKTVYDGQPGSTPVEVGTTGGRSQFSFDFNLTYNGQEDLGNVPEPELMGTLIYSMKFTNYGEVSTGYPIGSKDFTVTIKVYRRGQGTRYYLDGVNGKNSNKGNRPDDAMLTLSALFNRTDYLPGDEIYVVNKVTADNKLEWNGLVKGGNVLIYRYNGGHTLKDPTVGIIGNSANAAYTGPLAVVPDEGEMVVRGITLDGYYMNGGTYENNELVPYSTVTAAAPLISVEDGGTLELQQNVTLQQNYNTTDGGAVSVEEGATLMMNNDATIANNKSDGNGGGVYMAGTMIASDQVKVWDNLSEDKQNNVYLDGIHCMLQIGVEDSETYQDLDYDSEHPENSAKIGLSKPIDYFVNSIAEVVYSDETDWLVEPLNTQAIIVHDGNIYRLETGADPNILYWIDTWVTYVTTQPDGFAINNIDSEEDLAWVISLVNGENGQTPHTYVDQTIVLKKDLDMKDHTWVPIGEDNDVFKGIFEGNGHVVEGLISSLSRRNLGMFGITQDAKIQNVVAKANFNGTANNVGTIVGTMHGGSLTNVEAAGNLTGDEDYTQTVGGLVGTADEGALIHSSFAVNTIVAQRDETMVGGLVANNGADIYNSYSNVTATGTENTKIGGLVGENNGHIENCYAVVGSQSFPAFANVNNKDITICYADKANGYVKTSGNAATLTNHGAYGPVKGIKEIGYMYGDNAVSAANAYVVNALSYAGGKIDKWPGLLSTLNQWVDAINQTTGGDIVYSQWFRPTSNAINGDLPVLAFPSDNSLATTDGKFLHYGSTYNNANGLDNLFAKFDGKGANMFLYGNATNVEGGTGTNNHLFINEDAVLIQAPISAKEDEPQYNDIDATTGISFDNSDHGQNAYDYYGNKLTYDWHFMSTPLSDAITGATYTSGTFTNSSNANISGMEDGYFPNNLNLTTPAPEGSVMWDFYTYYEPDYHWINLKRGPGNHWHTDGGAAIDYNEADNTVEDATFIPGKGYMMAISQDSYLSNSGVLNNGNVPITLTNGEPDDLQYNKGWNLVGNPYQAYLDVSSLGTIYGYDADMGVYAPYSTSASVNPAIPAQNIHPHQAFFYHAATDGATLTFTPTMATTTEDPNSYFRAERVNYPLVNLFAQNAAGNRDLAVVEFNRPELGGATKVGFMTNANFQIAAHLDGENYGLLFTPENTEKVPVRFYTDEDGTFTLTWSTFNGDFTSLLLVDNMTGTITDMLRSDHYTFDAKTSDYASRFYLTYACTGVEEVNEGDGSFAFFDGSEWVVNGKGQLDIIDVTGRVLFSKRIANEQNRVNLNNVAPGVYMMRVSDGKDTMVQKIVVR